MHRCDTRWPPPGRSRIRVEEQWLGEGQSIQGCPFFFLVVCAVGDRGGRRDAELILIAEKLNLQMRRILYGWTISRKVMFRQTGM